MSEKFSSGTKKPKQTSKQTTNKQLFEIDQVSDYVRLRIEYLLLHVCINQSFDMSLQMKHLYFNIKMSYVTLNLLAIFDNI